MKGYVLLLLTLLPVAQAAAQERAASDRPTAQPIPARSPVQKSSRSAGQTAEQQAAATGDVSGGRFIPKPILEILADPRIDPNIAYILWQTARMPIDNWTLSELFFVTQTVPTLVEAGIPTDKLQALYQFLGLDPADLFNPRLGESWQSKSTAFDPNSTTNVGAISSADCQTDPGTMTVATFQTCTGGAQ
jgi:hypothetical protein